MTDVNQLADDLRYVRGAVEGRTYGGRPPAWVAWYWAAYVLVGYVLIDLNHPAAPLFFLVLGVAGGFLTGWASSRARRLAGVVDRSQGRRWAIHWMGGFAFIILAANGLAVMVPAVRGLVGSQVVVVMVGLLYFLAGVHGPAGTRYLIWAGPVVAAGGICVGLVPHHGWSALGALIAACILFPVFARAVGRPPVAA